MQLEALQSITLASARSRSVDEVLSEITHGLEVQPGVALVRIWLIAPGDICDSCPMLDDCPDQAHCLHLVASAGSSLSGTNWSGLEGDFRRFPLGVRKVGHIGKTGTPLLVQDIPGDDRWIARRDWAREEKIQGFAGQPLLFRDQVLGVLGLFSRSSLDDEQHGQLRIFADHAAVALANARAFEEIAQLRRQLEEERDYLREEIKEVQAFGEIIGDSDALRAGLQQIELVAPTQANVLILGESGTGKELVARAIHDRSPRRDRPMVRVNCASIPRDLFESEFFGHVRGAFTGAVRDRTGRFQLADGGTLFLDEVGEIPLDLQGKLLRVLQEGQLERVGEDHTREVDVRVIAATNQDLKLAVDAGSFRRDLFYRLSVFPIEMPSLRDRKEDIAPLARHFLRLCAGRLGRKPPRLRQVDIRMLQAYAWPGNIRELQNVLDRAVILSGSGPLRLDSALPPTAGPDAMSIKESSDGDDTPRVLTDTEMRLLERKNLQGALKAGHGKIYGPGGAADLLGIKPSTLASRMKTMGLKKPHSS
jgi:transcriptional regulator with GAF, ATPase, and Fis domain